MVRNWIKYRNTWTTKGSPLALAILESPAAAKRMYDETTAKFDALYPTAKDDRYWFEALAKSFETKKEIPCQT